MGFASALVLWVVWFFTHLPWMGLAESVSGPVCVGAWLAALIAGCVWAGHERALRVGLFSGFVAALLGLLILGSKLAKPSDASGVSPGMIPNAGLIALGFVLLGTAMGGVAGVISWGLKRQGAQRDWLWMFSIVAATTITPLLCIGGLVTSTDSGMAVPDWPKTYGTNMFMYPLGMRVQESMGKTYEQVFMEHSHRLFGTLVGLTTLCLLVWVLRAEVRRWVVGIAIAAFVLVVVQGVLGGVRVRVDSRWLAMGHGVLAQICFALIVALACVLMPAFKSFVSTDTDADAKLRKRAKMISTALLHTLILQLVFGALYRHTRSDHALWTHVGFSFVVAVIAMIGGFTLSAVGGKVGGVFSRVSWAVLISTVVQLILGWVAFLMTSKAHQAASVGEALLRTAHQANGALLLAAATAGYVWSRRMARELA